MNSIAQFDTLARGDPTVAPLAALQAAALRAAAAPYWQASVPPLDPARLKSGIPLLHEAAFTLESERVRSLLLELAAVAARAGVPGAETLRRALGGAARREPALVDARALLVASITGDNGYPEEAAARAGVDFALLVSLAHLAALPLLHACGHHAQPLLTDLVWEAGYCPVCAAWPLLAELRGLERQRWLRCGRCGAGWRSRNQICNFCGNRDHRTQGYLAPEAARESQQAVTCDECAGYLKTFTTLSPLSPDALLLRDLTTLELDISAIEHGYSRPARPGFPLRIELDEPVARAGWLPWRR